MSGAQLRNKKETLKFHYNKIKKVHIIAAGGVGTSALAVLFCEKGWAVSGSDLKLYPPADGILKKAGIRIYQGYGQKNIEDSKPDIVVVGNAVSVTNPEVEYCIKKGVRYRYGGKNDVPENAFLYMNFPEALYEYFIRGKTTIVITGTHGKTTTASLAAHVLTSLSAAPGFMIGGLPYDFGRNGTIGSGRYFITEGDEYNASCLNSDRKNDAKFLYYRPDYLVINNIELDHIDIYKNINEITASFLKLISGMKKDSSIFVSGDSSKVMRLVSGVKGQNIITFGLRKSRFTAEKIEFKEGVTAFTVAESGKRTIRIKSRLIGRHNIRNMLAVYSLCRCLGFKPENIAASIWSFSGVKKRMEVIARKRGNIFIEDFAHHPTEIENVTRALKEMYPDKKIISIFHPASTTSNTKVFQSDYAESFAAADIVIVTQMRLPERFERKERFSSERLVKDLVKKGKEASFVADKNDIPEFVKKRMEREKSGFVAVSHSSSDFSAVIRKTAEII